MPISSVWVKAGRFPFNNHTVDLIRKKPPSQRTESWQVVKSILLWYAYHRKNDITFNDPVALLDTAKVTQIPWAKYWRREWEKKRSFFANKSNGKAVCSKVILSFEKGIITNHSKMSLQTLLIESEEKLNKGMASLAARFVNGLQMSSVRKQFFFEQTTERDWQQ